MYKAIHTAVGALVITGTKSSLGRVRNSYRHSARPTSQILTIVTATTTDIRIEKHLQCDKLLGLAGGNTKKHGNKKSGECITPIRYNVLHM